MALKQRMSRSRFKLYAAAMTILAVLQSCSPAQSQRLMETPRRAASTASPAGEGPAVTRLQPSWETEYWGLSDFSIYGSYVSVPTFRKHCWLIEIRDFSDGRVVRTLGDSTLYRDTFAARQILGEDILLVRRSFHYWAAIGLGDGATRWEIGIRGEPRFLPTNRSDHWIYFDHDQLVCFNARDGRVRWRRTTSTSYSEYFEDDRRLFFVEHNKIVAVSLASGRTIWTHAVQDEHGCTSVVQGAGYLLANCGDLYRLDSSTGLVLERRPFPLAPGILLAATSRTLIASVPVPVDRARYFEGHRVETAIGIDLIKGKVRWKMPGVHWIGLTREAVFVRSEGGVIRALDPETGEILWDWGSGLYPVMVVEDPSGQPTVALGGYGKRSLEVLRPGTNVYPSASLVVRGSVVVDDRPAVGVGVCVNDQCSYTNSVGLYSVAVTVRGRLFATEQMADLERVAQYPCIRRSTYPYPVKAGQDRPEIHLRTESVWPDLCGCSECRAMLDTRQRPVYITGLGSMLMM